MSLTTIAMCWNRRSLARTSGGHRPALRRQKLGQLNLLRAQPQPDDAAPARRRRPVSSSYGRPDTPWSDTFANGSTPV